MTGTPVVGVDRCAAVDNQTAMIFSDQAPLHGFTDSKMLPVGTFPTGSDPDFDAIWAFVPSSLQPGPFDKMSVLFYFHGFNGWVTVDDGNKTGIPPHWATAGPFRPFPKPAAAAGPKYKLDNALVNNPLVLVPEDGVPRHDPRKDDNKNPIPGTFDGNWGKTAAGSLASNRQANTAALGLLVDDCFTHLQNLSNKFAAPTSGPPAPYLSKLAHTSDVKRFFLTGHSGGGVPLSFAAASDTAANTPTDLLLLDCTYGSTPSSLYVGFANGWLKKSKLGPGSGKSRMVVVCKPNTDTESQANDIRDQLKHLSLKISAPIHVAKPPFPRLPTADDMVELNFGGGNLTSLSSDVITYLQGAMSTFKVIFIKTNVAHDSTPNTFIPMLCASATVP